MSDEKQSSQGRFLEFTLGGEIYAIPLLLVREVISNPETTGIPQAPSYFEGIMNLRGQIISILDLRKKLKISPAEENKQEAVIILDFQEFRLGVIVDSINKVLKVEGSELKDVPLVQSKLSSEYISAVFERDEGLTIVIDIAKALDVSDIAIIKAKEAA